ncbi:MAG: hypothetical protein HQL48_11260 [Gammaproteobacteria bacterium]|nr:hypothetical protein [Gammaproteobacteria bacterium]
MSLALNHHFEEILEPLGHESANFFMAASLYHAKKLSFSAAASLAGLDFDAFAARLTEHFNSGYWLDDQVVLDDMAVVKKFKK